MRKIPCSVVLNVPGCQMSDFEARLAATKATLEEIAAEFTPAVFRIEPGGRRHGADRSHFAQPTEHRYIFSETGRLHAETLGMLDAVKNTYGTAITLFKPENTAVDAYVQQHADAFYDSVEMRKECCRIRKVEPLNRALAGNKAWVTGQRRAQAATRTELAVQEDDIAHGMQKFNPLADWSEEDVWHYIRSNQVPYNPLHDKGYPSIGCEPCTRAIQPGEDVRAGRWWWENPESKECGLHVVDGKLSA
jgi:phosphoadenosine phosphosulfate reductase